MTNEKQTKPLDILVVEDTPIHQESARILLGNEHNLEVVGTYDEAMDRLYDDDNWADKGLLKKNYDVLLTDMFFPKGEFEEAEPLGLSLGQFACLGRIPYVGVVSDANAHSNGVAWSMIYLNGKVALNNGSRFGVFTNSLTKMGDYGSRLLVKTDGSVTGVTYGFGERNAFEIPEGNLEEHLGFQIEKDANDGKNYFREMDTGYLDKIPEEAKDWLAVLTYLRTVPVEDQTQRERTEVEGGMKE